MEKSVPHRQVVLAVSRLLMLIAVAGPAIAQTQPLGGIVVDSATGIPLARASVALRDGAQTLVTLRTNDSGRFELRAPRSGAFTLEVRAIGFLAQTRPISVDSGEVVAGVFRLLQLAVSLDTVVTRDTGQRLFGLTPGRELYRRHFVRGIGQFISGTEIQFSRLSVIEFLGTIPGLKRVGFVPSPAPGAAEPNSPPTIAGRDGFLLSTSGPQCIYARIDHWSLPTLLDVNVSPYLEDVLTPEDVMAVEVYSPTEVPPEWAMFQQPTITLVADVGIFYFAADMGAGTSKRTSRNVDPRTRPDNTPITYASEYYSLNLPLMRTPKCALVQIWTRIAW